MGRGGLSSAPPRALVIFYPPHPNLPKNKQTTTPVRRMSHFLSFSFLSFLFLVRHFLLFKGNKASLIHNNFCLIFFFLVSVNFVIMRVSVFRLSKWRLPLPCTELANALPSCDFYTVHVGLKIRRISLRKVDRTSPTNNALYKKGILTSSHSI